MNIPTLCLDGVILGATSYPSGFSYSLVSVLRGDARRVSSGFLLILALPYFVVSPLALGMNPGLSHFHAPTAIFATLALVAAMVAILLEFGVHGVAQYRRSGIWPRRIALQSFWTSHLTMIDHALLMATAVGEEIFFRMIWVGVLVALGSPTWAAVLISALAYGFNHFYAGWLTVSSKAAVGLLLGALYVGGGFSIWLPILAHVMQNALLFAVVNKRHA